MSLVKTSLLNGIAVLVKVASALVLNKILALYVGPTGYAIIGQFQNTVSIVVNLTGGVVAAGVTTTTAQYFDNEAKQHAVWKTAIRFALGASLIASISLLIIGNWLSTRLLHRADMSGVFIWLALTLPAMALNTLFLAIINGKKEVGVYVKANIIGSLIVMLVTGLLSYNFGLYGALVAFAINPAIALLSTGVLCASLPWIKIKFIWGQMTRTALNELAGFGLMGLTSALVIPLTSMLIRDYLVNKLGLTAAGYWQATWKISEIYLMLVTSTLAVYYLPRIAEIRTSSDLLSEIRKVYIFSMPIVVTGAGVIFILRDFIINLLFTTDFLPMRDLFGWQLTGDVMKIGSFVLAYIMIGRAMVKYYIFTEILFSLLFLFLNFIFVDKYGLQGVAIAYTTTYIFYWIFMVFIIRAEISNLDHSKNKFNL